MNPIAVEGELRASKGALIFIPEGTQQYLRVDVPLALERGFRRGRARMVLAQSAGTVIETKRFPVGVQPEHGVPQRIIGEVISQGDGELVVESGGVTVVVRPPDRDHSYKGRVLCEMNGALEGRDAALL